MSINRYVNKYKTILSNINSDNEFNKLDLNLKK